MDQFVGFLSCHRRLARFDDVWIVLPLYHRQYILQMLYTEFAQWQRQDTYQFIHVILVTQAVSLSKPKPVQIECFRTALYTVCGLSECTLLSHDLSHTANPLQWISNAFQQYHQIKNVSRELCATETTKMLSRNMPTRYVPICTVRSGNLAMLFLLVKQYVQTVSQTIVLQLSQNTHFSTLQYQYQRVWQIRDVDHGQP